MLEMVVTVLLIVLLVCNVIVFTGLIPLSFVSMNYETVCVGTDEGMIEMTLLSADTPLKRFKGLSGCGEMSHDGLLIRYSRERKRTVVMRNMSFPIDVAFVDESGTVNRIKSLDEPENLTEYYLLYARASGRAQYVLELESGRCEELGIQEGSAVELNRN